MTTIEIVGSGNGMISDAADPGPFAPWSLNRVFGRNLNGAIHDCDYTGQAPTVNVKSFSAPGNFTIPR